MGDTVNNVEVVSKNDAPKNEASKGASKDVAPKRSKFKSLKAEFKKITWPDRPTLIKQTIAVIAISIVVGALIVGVDALYKLAFDKIGIFGVLG